VTRPGGCPLCEGPGGQPVFEGAKFRVIRTDEGGFPAFYRLVWTDHVAEFSDLPAADRRLCMEAVVLVEQCLRSHLQPDKVNLAALGNAVPHLHWHVIGRFRWDSHFPAPVWGAAQRPASANEVARIVAFRPALESEMAGLLARQAGLGQVPGI
jgi:diadenosine tetraphosphate (Ap4A) HIT family hydrolase